MTQTLTEFLLARIAEDEGDAQAAITIQSPHWTCNGYDAAVEVDVENWNLVSGEGTFETQVVYDEGAPTLFQAEHIARWDPARVLAECEAKRRIVEMQAANDEGRHQVGFHFRAQTIERVLRLLALPYMDHPDYDEAWRP